MALASLLGLVSGFFLVVGMFQLLGELPGDGERTTGLLVSLVFEMIGVALMFVSRRNRASTAGVALAGVAVVPLLVYAFVDIHNPSRTFESVGRFTTTTTLILLGAAAVWLVAHFFAPSGRHAVFLGAALVAVWMAMVIQVSREPARQMADSFGLGFGPPVVFDSTASGDFDAVGDPFAEIDEQWAQFDAGKVRCDGEVLVEGDPTFWSCFDGNPIQTSESFDPTSPDQFGDTGFSGEEDFSSTNDLGSRLGWTSLFFGVVYLATAGYLDRRRDHRRATAFFAVAAPVLVVGVTYLDQSIGANLQALLAIVLGTAAAILATRTNRRFTAWAGTLAVVVGTGNLVFQTTDSGSTLAVVFLLLGALTMVGALALDRAGFGAPGGPPVALAETGPPTPNVNDSQWAPAPPVVVAPEPEAVGPAPDITRPPEAPTFEPPTGPTPFPPAE